MRTVACLLWVLVVPQVLRGQAAVTPHRYGAHDESRDAAHLSPAARATARAPARQWTRTAAGGRTFTSVQVNVADGVDNIIGDAANEPSIAVNPLNYNQMAIGWRQFDDNMNSLREAGFAYSHDGGATWTFPGVLEDGAFRSDPVLAADAEGNFYYLSLGSDAGALDSPCALFRSSDGGASWARVATFPNFDKPWFDIDRTQGPGRGNIYTVWRFWELTRSIDGGGCFEPTVSTAGDFVIPAVAPDGSVYVAADIGGGMFRVAWLAEMANDDAALKIDSVVDVNLGVTLLHGTPMSGGLHGQPWIVADHSSGRTRGNLYLLASGETTLPNRSDVVISRSTDGGKTWSEPIKINDDPRSGAWHWFGAISVAPNGRIDVTWYDTRNAANNIDSEVYYSFSDDGGSSWSENIAITPSFDPRLGFQPKLGDYTHMYSTESYAMLAYAATFNGEHDVYFVRVPHDCNGNGVLDDVETAAGEGDCNANGIPDGCEPGGLSDCNANEVTDICDITASTSGDCDHNGVPDECERAADCDGDGLLDVCAIRTSTAQDCNRNGVPDHCDVASGASADADRTGAPDECEHRVPEEFKTIQAAVDAAVSGQVILLADGTHSGPGNHDVIIDGKQIVVRSEHGPERCIIDPAGQGRALEVMGECRTIRFRDITFKNGLASEGGALRNDGQSTMEASGCVFDGNDGGSRGGALFSNSANVVITDCRFVSNRADRGAGATVIEAQSTFERCTWLGNVAAAAGGAIDGTGGRLACHGSLFSGNGAVVGGAVFLTGGSQHFTNCTMFSNVASGAGTAGGVLMVNTQTELANGVLWGNTAGGDEGPVEDAQLKLVAGADIEVTHSLIQGLTMLEGTGNLDADPLFIDAHGPDGIAGTQDDDLHLAAGSPAIDSGRNAAVPAGLGVDLDGQPRLVDDPATRDCPQPGADCGAPPIVDLGAYEFQVVPTIAIISSMPPDGAVDARQPSAIDGSSPSGWDMVTLDFDGDASRVGVADFELAAANGPPPSIARLEAAGRQLIVHFDASISPGDCVALRHVPSETAVRLAALPADVNADHTASQIDILALIDGLNGTIQLQPWQCDLDRSGSCAPVDILRAIDLLNGAGACSVWNGATLPECP